MIQRIQTIYLIVVAALMAVALFAPLGWFAAEGEEFTLRALGLENAAGETVQSTLHLAVLAVAATLLPVAVIFLFRRRMLQLRLCAVEAVLLLGTALMEGIYYFLGWRFFAQTQFHAQALRPAIALPLVCLVLVYLAARAILRDEALVRAADRIR